MAESLLPALDAEPFAALKRNLGRLAASPPRTLLLEGGREEERRQAALYWAMAVNCRQGSGRGQPCQSCDLCRQLAAREHLDLLLFDGRIANSADGEGPVRALSAENMRELKVQLRDLPHGPGWRVVVLMGLGLNRGGAANALLKALEEPPPQTLFTLLAPQRGQLLPTLVSRSFCLTLPWPDSAGRDAGLSGWEAELAVFLAGRGDFLEKVAARGALDAEAAQGIVLLAQKALIRARLGDIGDALAKALAGMAPAAFIAASRRLALAQDMLESGVAPARVLESLATALWLVVHGHAA